MKKVTTAIAALFASDKGLKNYLLIIAAALAYLSFFSSINKLSVFTAFKSFFYNTVSNHILDCLFGFICLIALGWLVIKLKKISPRGLVQTLTLPLILVGIYLFHRNNWLPAQDWHYLPFSFLPTIYYADIACLFLAVYFFHPNKQPTVHKITRNLLLEDDIDQEGSNDLFKRSAYAQKMAQIIMEQKTKKSFAIGITGKWGSGKTTFIREINKHIPDCIPIHFNPWLSKSSGMIAQDFFELVIDAVQPYDQSLSARLKKYAQTLLNIEQSFSFKISAFLTGNGNGGYKSIEKQRQQIRDCIQQNGIKIVTFVDDIDRLNGAEIMAVLSIIRNSFDFPNMFFIVGYDYEYLIKVMENEKVENAEKFLHKIFQLEIELPAFPDTLLQETLINLLCADRTVEQANIIKHSIISLNQLAPLSQYISNLRDCVRIRNSIHHIMDVKFAEIDFTDFFILELFKIVDKKGYYLIKEVAFREKTYSFLDIHEEMIRFTEGNIITGKNEFPLPLVLLFKYMLHREGEIDKKSLRIASNAIRYFSDHLFGSISFTQIDKHKENSSFPAFITYINDCIGHEAEKSLVDILNIMPFPDNRTAFINLARGFNVIRNATQNNNVGDKLFTAVHRDNFAAGYPSFTFDFSLFDEITTPLQLPAYAEIEILVWLERLNNKQGLPFYQDAQPLKIKLLLLFVQSMEASPSFNNELLNMFDRIHSLKIPDLSVECSEKLQGYLNKHAIQFIKSGIVYIENEKKIYFSTILSKIYGWQAFEDFLRYVKEDYDITVLKNLFWQFKENGYQALDIDKINAYTITAMSDANTIFTHSPNYPLLQSKPALINKRFYKLEKSNTHPVLQHSHWISGTDKSSFNEALEGGRYHFERKIMIDDRCFPIRSASLYYLIDDYLTIVVNGHIIEAEGGWGSLKSVTIDPNYFIAGENTIIFIVRNMKHREEDVIGSNDPNPYEIIYNLVLDTVKPVFDVRHLTPSIYKYNITFLES